MGTIFKRSIIENKMQRCCSHLAIVEEKKNLVSEWQGFENLMEVTQDNRVWIVRLEKMEALVSRRKLEYSDLAERTALNQCDILEFADSSMEDPVSLNHHQ